MQGGVKTIMEIMGHETYTMGMRYQHPAPDHRLSAVRKLDSLRGQGECVIDISERAQPKGHK